MIGRISKVRKRDGRLVDFDETKIADAVHKAGCAVGREDRFLAEELAGVVTLFLEKRYTGQVPGIEEIQDMVEKVLIETGHARMAKAYILYRERRARAREQVSVRGDSTPGPMVGNPAKALVSPWAKARIAAALVREADLDARVAAQVAASVERKVIERGVTSLTTAVIRSLVEAELFDRGFADRVGRQALVGLPRYDLDCLLRGGKEARWRPSGPRDLKSAVADAVLAQYALSEIYSAEVVDAHLGARLHILDVGSPFEWLAASHVLPECGSPDDWIEAIVDSVGRLGRVVTRELALSGVAPAECEWASDGAMRAARRLLAHGALRTEGRLRVVLTLPAMAAAEGPLRLAESLVREHWARFRSGQVAGLPELVLRVPADAIDGADGRRALLPPLAAAAETGRLLFVYDRGGAPALVTPWYRVPAPESAGSAALPVAGAVAVNVGRIGAGAEEELLEALDAAVAVAIKALAQKRSFMAGLQADPSGPLYRVAAGGHALLAGPRAIDLVHLVGVQEAAARLEREPAAVARLTGRLRSYAAVRIAEEGRGVRLRAFAAPERDGEGARRFAEAAGAASWDDREPYALPPEVWHDGLEARFEPVAGTLSLRFPREAAPAPEALYDAFCLLARDPRVGAVRLNPWPDRSVQPAGADL